MLMNTFSSETVLFSRYSDGLRLEGRGSIPSSVRLFSSPQRPDDDDDDDDNDNDEESHIMSPGIETGLRCNKAASNRLSWGTAHDFIRGTIYMKLITHLHKVRKLRIRGVIPPLPNMSSWYGA
jgi:hypothetical protein